MKSIKCRVLQYGKPNLNGRVYSEDVIKAAVDNYKKEYKEKGDVMLGHLGAANDRPSWDILGVKLGDVSHRIEDLYFEDNLLYFYGALLDTPNGKIAQQMLEQGIPMGAEICGTGEMNDNKEITTFNLSYINILPKEQCAWEDSEVHIINENKCISDETE